VTTWLKLDAYTSGNNRLAAKQAASTFGGFSWNMNATPNSGPVGPDNFRLGLFLGNNVSSGPTDFGSAFSSDDVDAHNKWAFLAVTYDGTLASSNTKFYIGGATTPVTQLGADQTMVQLTIEGGAALFGVGYTDAAPAANTSAIGLQDDVRVYGTALTLAELEDVRQSNAGTEPPAPGDYNNNGIVDAADYVAWRNGGPLQNEIATIGSATPEDFNEWRARFGNSAGSGTAVPSVPEPSVLLLVITTCSVVVAFTSTRR
jgi:hypothetical protein